MSLYSKNTPLQTAQAFTSVALINLLTIPVIQLVQLMPQLLQCVGSFVRIQEYCNYANNGIEINESKRPTNHAGSSISLHSLAQLELAQREDNTRDAITLRNNSFAWDKAKTPFLKDIDINIPVGSFTVCVGAVGSGKSMLLESMLGETISSLGPMPKWASSLAYCAQEPWLENGTIRSNIIGISSYDPKWYKMVKSACGLLTDLQALERGDKTVVGSKGLNLSGGQKQRIVSVSYERNREHSGLCLYLVGSRACRLLTQEYLYP